VAKTRTRRRSTKKKGLAAADEPILKLRLLDAFERPIQEAAIITLRNMTLSDVKQARSEAGKTVAITGLRGAPTGIYRLEVDPLAYFASGRFVSLGASGTTDADLFLAVDPSRVSHVAFPQFPDLPSDAQRLLTASEQVAGFEGMAGRALYDRVDDIRRAGFLNIVTKCLATVMPDGRPVASYLEELRDLRGDRFFCRVPQQLRDDVKNAAQDGLFDGVSGALHHPPDGFSPAGSFKTPDHYGNLQLTFFAGPTFWVADIDIDDANGLAHTFQVLRNQLTGRPTHPYDIHQILMRHQHLDTGYRLEI
jgi:hypothetical protein